MQVVRREGARRLAMRDRGAHNGLPGKTRAGFIGPIWVQKNEAVEIWEGTPLRPSRWLHGGWHAVVLDRCAAKNEGARRRAPSRTVPWCCAVCRCHPSLAGTACRCRPAYRWHRSRGHRWRPLVLTLKGRHAPLSRCCSKTSDSRFARGWLQRGAACLLQFLHLAAVVCSDCMPFGTARPTN